MKPPAKIPAAPFLPPGAGDYATLCQLSRLRQGWRRVKANHGGPGGDGITMGQFERELDAQLLLLSEALRAGTYRPGPVRVVKLRKPDGGWRRLSIPCIRDRVAQAACLTLIAPALDARMSARSFGYRPARSVDMAVADVKAGLDRGLRWVVDADIRRFFDSVPHRRVLPELAIWLDDERMLGFLARSLKPGTKDDCGLPQGAPIAPLIANLYLHPMDRILSAAEFFHIRYADDFVILCQDREDAKRALAMVQGILKDRGLALHPEKTRIVHASEGFVFLGRNLKTGGGLLPWRRAR